MRLGRWTVRHVRVYHRELPPVRSVVASPCLPDDRHNTFKASLRAGRLCSSHRFPERLLVLALPVGLCPSARPEVTPTAYAIKGGAVRCIDRAGSVVVGLLITSHE